LVSIFVTNRHVKFLFELFRDEVRLDFPTNVKYNIE